MERDFKAKQFFRKIFIIICVIILCVQYRYIKYLVKHIIHLNILYCSCIMVHILYIPYILLSLYICRYCQRCGLHVIFFCAFHINIFPLSLLHSVRV